LDTVQRWVAEPPPDDLFEIADRSLAGVSPRNPAQIREQIALERLLTVSPSAANIVKPALVREVLPKVAGSPVKRMNAALVIPDYATRMGVLDFEEFPPSEEERIALIRFRLRKTVPFPIDEAQIAYAIQVQEPKRFEVLAVAIARPILTDYELLFTDQGYRLGLVTPSSIATLPLCFTSEPGLTLLAKAAGSVLSMLLLEQKRIRLVRCLDLAEGEEAQETPHLDTVVSLLQQTVAYAEDQIGARVTRILLCGFGASTESLASVAEQEFGVSCNRVRSKRGAVSVYNAGILGLLEQYAA